MKRYILKRISDGTYVGYCGDTTINNAVQPNGDELIAIGRCQLYFENDFIQWAKEWASTFSFIEVKQNPEGFWFFA